ncbi:deoxycytidine triphosphate deaminase [Microbacterium sp. BE35]|uniref:dCTP deaminase n=1 Tax=Microbacterium sp. BE35 TaxID=2817773 RepID=UPI00285B6114|nr:dCTP deaminase [Microbacterium sp. BE35]MDR7188137.1 deoxycytidine triphosphate deaminase [Microbacterium sp. BE35]
MKLTSQRLIASGALDIRARFVRLLSLLERIASSATESERRILDWLIAVTRDRLEKYVENVAGIIEGGHAMVAKAPGAPWPSPFRTYLVKAAEEGYQSLRQAHSTAYPYISGRTTVPDDLRHFLFRSVGLSLVSPTHREAIAIYPSSHMVWESSSTRVQTDADDFATAGILIPYSEIASPLRWPLLVHELGHHISPGGHSSDTLRAEALKRHGVEELDDALSELQADRIAERATGATYAVAMAREGYLLRIGKHFKQGGPTVQQRLTELSYGADVADALPAEWHLDGTRVDMDTNEPEELFDPDALQTLSSIVGEIVPAPDEQDSSARIARARTLLRNGDPIPSIPRGITPPPEVFEQAAAGLLTKQEVVDLFNAIVEDPLTDAEILEAAWQQELDQDEESMLTRLIDPVTDEQLEKEMAALEAEDVRLSRSLQAAAVHRWLLENDADIAERAHIAESESSSAEPDVVQSSPLEAESKEADEPDVPISAVESAPLSDVQLVRRLNLPAKHRQRLVVRPIVDPDQVGGTTIDLRLGTEWEMLRTSRFRSLDPSDDQAQATDLLNRSVDEYRLAADDPHGLVLHPGELLLALSLEYLSLPNDLWGLLEGRSTWARLGLQVHATAGMVDAGFKGFLTLELQNTGRLPMVMYPGIRVGQLAFFPVAGIARPYGAKPGAAYADQARVRTAFTNQHEHRARHAYMQREEAAEKRRRESSQRKDER